MFGWNPFGVVHRNEAIGVTRIPDDKHPNIRCRVLFDRATLTGEDLAIDPEKFFSFHPLFPRDATHKQRPVHVAKAFREVRGWDDF